MPRLARATFTLMLALLAVFAIVVGAVLGQVPTARNLVGTGRVVAEIGVHRSPTAANEQSTALDDAIR